MKTTNTLSEYDQQAETFLTTHGLKFRATLSDSKTPAWSEGEKCGRHYRVTISRDGYKRKRGWYEWQNKSNGHPGILFGPQSRLTFDFWSSIADAEKGIVTVKPYDVLACISADAYTPATFADFCAEYGYEEDSIKALQMFRRCDRFAKRLRAFFTEQELADLSEIR